MNRKKVAWIVTAVAIIGLLGGAIALAKPPIKPLPIDCRFVLCAFPDCTENEHIVIPPGQCCPVCVPN